MILDQIKAEIEEQIITIAGQARDLIEKNDEIIKLRETNALLLTENAAKDARIAELLASRPRILLQSDWSKGLGDFIPQQKVAGRIKTNWLIGNVPTLRLHTEPGDNEVAGSGAHERADVYLAKPGTADPLYFGEGTEQWWRFPLYLPSDYEIPPKDSRYSRSWNLLLDFHLPGALAPQPFNIEIATFLNEPLSSTNPRMRLTGIGWNVDLGAPVLQKWYDFVLHVRWGQSGFFNVWLDGKQVLSRPGPTLPVGQQVYPKLANYHVSHGKASSVHWGQVTLSEGSLVQT